MAKSSADASSDESNPLPVVVVTGSSGLLGRPVCSRLAENGFKVIGLDRVGLPEPPKSHPNVEDIECDTSDSNSVKTAFSAVSDRVGKKLASVVHLAAYYDFSGEDSPLYEEVTIQGTDRILNALATFKLDQFLFSSTMLVHKPCAIGDRIDENSALQAEWAYPQSKIDTEKLIREGHPNVHSLILRLAGVYTDFGTQPTLVQQIKRTYEKDFQSHFYPGDTKTGQAAVHIDDAVNSIVLAVQHRTSIPPKEAILIGEPDPPSYDELQNEIASLLHGKDWAMINVPKFFAKAGATVMNTVTGGESFIKPFMVDMAEDHYDLDISKAERILRWTPQHRLLDHLRIIIDNLKNDPEKWYKKNGLDK